MARGHRVAWVHSQGGGPARCAAPTPPGSPGRGGRGGHSWRCASVLAPSLPHAACSNGRGASRVGLWWCVPLTAAPPSTPPTAWPRAAPRRQGRHVRATPAPCRPQHLLTLRALCRPAAPLPCCHTVRRSTCGRHSGVWFEGRQGEAGSRCVPLARVSAPRASSKNGLPRGDRCGVQRRCERGQRERARGGGSASTRVVRVGGRGSEGRQGAHCVASRMEAVPALQASARAASADARPLPRVRPR